MSVNEELFTLRLWKEWTGSQTSEWRGKIQHVNSGDTQYFREWQKMNGFIASTLSQPFEIEPQEVGTTVPSEPVKSRLHPKRKHQRRKPSNQFHRMNVHKPITGPVRKTTGEDNKNGGRLTKSIFAHIRSFFRKVMGERFRTARRLGYVAFGIVTIVVGVNYLQMVDPKITGLITGIMPFFLGLVPLVKEGIHPKKHARFLTDK